MSDRKIFEGGEMQCEIVMHKGEKHISIDDLIAYLKYNAAPFKEDEVIYGVLHEIIKAFVIVKNNR